MNLKSSKMKVTAQITAMTILLGMALASGPLAFRGETQDNILATPTVSAATPTVSPTITSVVIPDTQKSSDIQKSSDTQKPFKPAHLRAEQFCEYDGNSDLLIPLKLLSVPEPTRITVQFHGTDIDLAKLMAVYLQNSEGLHKDDLATISTLIEFFYTQMGVDKSITAGIIGNILNEGCFAEQQATYRIAPDYDTYIEWLDLADDRGYGIIQWTSQHRQNKLKKYLENNLTVLSKVYNKDESEFKSGKYFALLVVYSECCFAYDEILSYDIIEDYQTEYTIENITGRLARDYEAYHNSGKQWRIKSDTQEYYFTGADGTSGAKRLNSAYTVYDEFDTYLQNASSIVPVVEGDSYVNIYPN